MLSFQSLSGGWMERVMGSCSVSRRLSDGACTGKASRVSVHTQIASGWWPGFSVNESLPRQMGCGLWEANPKLFFFFLTTELSQRDKSLDHHFIPDGRWLKVTTVIFSSHLSGLL